jgi:hypothetical protein
MTSSHQLVGSNNLRTFEAIRDDAHAAIGIDSARHTDNNLTSSDCAIYYECSWYIGHSVMSALVA